MADHTKYSYEQKLAKLREILGSRGSFGDAVESDIVQQLMEMVVDVTDSLHYMLERRTTESYLGQAQLESSVITRASELGYRFRRAKSNKGKMRISLVDSSVAPENIIIPIFTRIEGEEREFYTTEEVIFKQNTPYVDVMVKEGNYYEQEFVSDSFNEITIPDYRLIDNDFMVVSVGGDIYLDVVTQHPEVNKNAIAFLDSDEAYYDIRYDVNGMRIAFGDGKFGKRPDKDLNNDGTFNVKVQSIVVGSNQEPVLSTGNVYKMDSVYGTLGEYKVNVTNPNAITGFSLPESNESIKRNATTFNRSNFRAVTNEDYSYWSKNTGVQSIIDTRAYGEDEINSLVFNANNVYITYLKEDGTDLTFEEEQQFRTFMNGVKTSMAHLVLVNADSLKVQFDVKLKKHHTNPAPNGRVYEEVRSFLSEQMSAPTRVIGGSVYVSDLVRDMYTLKSEIGGVEYPLIEFVEIEMEAVYPFKKPSITERTFISLPADFDFASNAGKTANLTISTVPVHTTIDASDDEITFYNRLRDKIMQNTRLQATVVVRGVLHDERGNPLPLPVDTTIGEPLLIGMATPDWFPDEKARTTPYMIEGMAIGTTSAYVKQASPSVTVGHGYYAQPAGYRPLIPLRPNTVVTFTAPNDAPVEVYIDPDHDDGVAPAVPTTTIWPNQTYTFTSTTEQTIQFKFLSDSSEHVEVSIAYPEYAAQPSFGVDVKSFDRISTFDVIPNGDVVMDADYTYTVPKLPNDNSDAQQLTPTILPKSLRIVDKANNTLYRDDGQGGFTEEDGITPVPSGVINYVEGVVNLPVELPVSEDDYFFVYKQNTYNVLQVTANAALDLIEPAVEYQSPTPTFSTIRIV